MPTWVRVRAKRLRPVRAGRGRQRRRRLLITVASSEAHLGPTGGRMGRLVVELTGLGDPAPRPSSWPRTVPRRYRSRSGAGNSPGDARTGMLL